MLKKVLLAMLSACLALCSGCSLLFYAKTLPDWEATDYTVEDIRDMGIDSSENCKLGDETDVDCTKKAIKAYNTMLGYAENVADFEYKVYDFYYVEYTESYVIKIVPKERAQMAENDGYNLCDVEILMLSCDTDGTDFQGQIETYLMSRRWTQDLQTAMSEEFPDYHLNTEYVSLDHFVPDVKDENYTDHSDYTHFFKEDFYEGTDILTFYDNIVNVIVPNGIVEETARDIFGKIEPILREYYVTGVNIYSPTSDEIYDKWLSQELVSGNYYYDDDEINWEQFFSLTN